MSLGKDSVTRRQRLSAAVGLALMLGFAFRCLDRFAGAGHDDAFITLLAAEQLAAGSGFVTPNGEPGEAGSSLLHVLLLTPLSWLGVPDLYLANKLLGLSFGAAALVCVYRQRAILFGASHSPLVAASIAVAWGMWLPTYAFWTMGGLETPIVAFLLTWLAMLSLEDRNARLTGAAAFLLTLARPEGFVYLGAVLLLGMMLRRERAWWRAAFVTPLLLFSLVSLARQIWIGSFMPLPVLAKAGDVALWQRLAAGLDYLLAFSKASWTGLLFMLVAGSRALQLIWHKLAKGAVPHGAAVVVPVSVSATHLGAVVVAGGDWMAYYRFVAPVVPLLSVMFVQWLSGAAVLRGGTRTLQASFVALLFAGVPWLTEEKSGLSPPYMHNTCMQRSLSDLVSDEIGDSFGERIRRLNHPYWRDEHQLRPFLVGWLAELAERRGRVTIASYQMGFFPYEARRFGIRNLRFVDTVGILDPVLARIPGERSSIGLTIGTQPDAFLDPKATDPVAREIQSRRPDLLYVLRIHSAARARLASWGWILVWDAPEAKVFARANLLAEKAGWSGNETRARRTP